MLICVVLKLVAIISLPTTFFLQKKVSVSGTLALSDDLQRLCSPVLFSYQGGRV